MPQQPLAEVFGYRIDDMIPEAIRHRQFKQCPVGNKMPSCTKDEYVNVASVPQRSPWRYPGGKTWLVPRIRQWLASLPQKPARLIEPFAGGGTVSLTAAFEDRTLDGATMVDLDPDIAAAWQTMLDGQAEWLAQRIVDFDLTHENIRAQLDMPDPPRH